MFILRKMSLYFELVLLINFHFTVLFQNIFICENVKVVNNKYFLKFFSQSMQLDSTNLLQNMVALILTKKSILVMPNSIFQLHSNWC